MGNGMNKILPGLYIGNFRDAKDEKQLSENNITHIVSVHDNARKILEDKEYLCIVASDCPDQDLIKFFPQVNKFIHKARLEGGSVLVHCLAGVSRSVTVTAAYIMTVTNLGWRDSLNCIRGARSVANPNFGFQKQLQNYENEHLEEERRKLKAMFPTNSFRDEEECQINLRCFQQFVLTGNLPSRSDDLYPLPHRAYEGQARREACSKQNVPGQVQSNNTDNDDTGNNMAGTSRDDRRPVDDYTYTDHLFPSLAVCEDSALSPSPQSDDVQDKSKEIS
ncbi:hypothetical protein BsWGS_16021 [Bradybaena similaris]